jgi:hypothetical protein
MKNFARIFDLGAVECCCYRQEATKIVFAFWMRKGNDLFSPTCTKEYPAPWVVQGLFEQYEDLLKEQAQEVLDMIQHQINLHGDEMQNDKQLVLDGNTIDKLYKAPK